MAKNVRTYNLSEPLNGATAAQADINVGDGNFWIDGLTGDEPVLASGSLQYLEKQDAPTHSVNMSSGQAAFTLKAGGKGQSWFRLPWAACNGATEWRIHLNPSVSFDITAHTDGGNVRLDLTGMTVTRVAADTSGGNMEVILPDNVTDLNATVKSGAGNVVVQIPGGIAARIQATSGLGKVMIDPRFYKIDKTTYQSPDYDSAASRVEITVSSGAGNVSVTERIAQSGAAAIPIFVPAGK